MLQPLLARNFYLTFEYSEEDHIVEKLRGNSVNLTHQVRKFNKDTASNTFSIEFSVPEQLDNFIRNIRSMITMCVCYRTGSQDTLAVEIYKIDKITSEHMEFDYNSNSVLVLTVEGIMQYIDTEYYEVP